MNAAKKCQIKHCNLEYKKAYEYANKIVKESVEAVQLFKDKKINIVELIKRSKNIKNKLLESPYNKELSKCSFEHCYKECEDLLKVFVDLLNKDCKDGNQRACLNLEEAIKIMKGKLTLQKYHKFSKLLLNS